jgi:YVTN family beta-propeller protein
MKRMKSIVWAALFAVVVLSPPSPANAALGVVTAVPTGTRPQTAVINPVTHRLYVAHDSSLPADSFVTVINTLTNTVLTTVPVQKTARSIAINTVTNRVYVANMDSNSVSVIDGVTNSVIANLASPGVMTKAVAVDESTDRFYSAGHEWLVAWDGGTNGVICTRQIVSVDIEGIGVNPNNHRVLALAFGAFPYDRYNVVDGTNCGLLSSNQPQTCGAESRSIVYNNADNHFYAVGYNSGTIAGYSGTTGSLDRCINAGVPDGGFGIGLDAPNQTLYGSFNRNPLTKIDIATGHVLGNLSTGLEMNGIGIEPRACATGVFVANHFDNQVLVVKDDVPCPPVGGIAEQPDVAALPAQTPTAAAGNRTAYALGSAAAAALAIVAAGGWAMRRRCSE